MTARNGLEDLHQICEAVVDLDAPMFEEGLQHFDAHLLGVGCVAQHGIQVFDRPEAPVLGHLIFEDVLKGFPCLLLHPEAVGVHLGDGIEYRGNEALRVDTELLGVVNVDDAGVVVDAAADDAGEG